MRNGVLAVMLVVVALLGRSLAGTKITPTTTLSAETANNTSTANLYAADASGNLGASNISKVDIRKLLYPGSNTPVYVHFMGWFGTSSHIDVGYTSWDPAQVHRQVDDMLSRGITGAILDWYGPNKWTEESTAKYLKLEAEARNGQFWFALTEDKGALLSCAATLGCDLTQQLITDLTYAYNNYEVSPAYLQVNGRSLVFFFDVDTDYPINWDQVVASVPGNPMFVFRNSGGFAKPHSSGSFAWVGFPDSSTQWGQSYLDNFYSTSLNYPTGNVIGTGYKGFNDTLASWGKNRLVPQDCGQTWMAGLAEIGHYYSSSSQLGSIQLVTWNDYEEGTALETGIDNCVTVAASTTGDALSWNITGDESTIDHYTVFISSDGENLMALRDLPAGTHALDLSTYGFDPGSYVLYVKAIGQPFLKNQMSAAISYGIDLPPPPAPPPAPLTPAPQPDFTLSMVPSGLTVARGQAGALSVTLTPQGGFSSAVVFSCSNLPLNSSCVFAPASLTPGSNPVAATVTITAAGPSAALRPSSPLLFATWLPALGLVLATGRRKRRCLLTGAVLALALMHLHCGGSPAVKAPVTSGGTPAGTYTVMVTAASGSLQHSATAKVTVQ